MEFVQGGQVKGREVVSIIPADEVQQTAAGAGSRDRPGAARSAIKVQMLKGGDYLRVWIARQGIQYLIHLPVGSRIEPGSAEARAHEPLYLEHHR